MPLDSASTAGATLAVNPRLKQMLGWAADTEESTIAPLDAGQVVDPSALAAFLDRLATERVVTDYPLGLRRRDGTTLWVEVTARAERTKPGLLRVEALLRDVSERRQEDERSRDLAQQLQQADKLAALGQTISGVAHELNNPLATILTWAERLAARTTDEPSRRAVEVILGEAERAARIVRSLLTIARKRQSTRSMLDVNRTVRDVLALRADEQRGQRIEVVTALADGLPRVFADGHKIQQVLLNLVVNAEQAMTAALGGGSLVVRTWHDTERESVVIEVTDDGPGVPDAVRARVFDPFFTTKDVGKGTGLGLTVAYAIVQEHGGRIRLEPAPGRGASFVVELPVPAGDAPAAARPAPARPPRVAVQGAAVLLVEDEAALAEAVTEALCDAGLTVDHASDGQEALARIRHHAYDVVVCDLKMPRVDGMMVYRAIAAATPALARRVIFVTGDVAGTEAERFLEESGCRWLAKPFRLADLVAAIRDTLG